MYVIFPYVVNKYGCVIKELNHHKCQQNPTEFALGIIAGLQYKYKHVIASIYALDPTTGRTTYLHNV